MDLGEVIGELGIQLLDEFGRGPATPIPVFSCSSSAARESLEPKFASIAKLLRGLKRCLLYTSDAADEHRDV